MTHPFSDAHWWHEQASFDVIAKARAKELYPGLFHENGALKDWSRDKRDLPRNTVRQVDSLAYRKDGKSLATKDFGRNAA